MILEIYRGASFEQPLVTDELGMPPELLAQAYLLMDIKKREKDKQPLLRLSSDNGGLFYEPSLGVLVMSILPEDTRNIKCTEGVYDVLAILQTSYGPSIHRLFGGRIDFRDLVTDPLLPVEGAGYAG